MLWKHSRLRSFGVKPILDYSVEEDLSQEEAEKREVEWVTTIPTCLLITYKFLYYRSSVSSAGDVKDDGTIAQYHVEKSFADRRYKVSSARTYFYLNEATCERNMEIFIKCLEAVSGKGAKLLGASHFHRLKSSKIISAANKLISTNHNYLPNLTLWIL